MRIIYFDGVCNLCNGFVDFIIRNDPQKKFFFASLQGQNAKQQSSLQDLGLASVVLVVDQKKYIKSKAVLQIFSELNGYFVIVSKIGGLLPIKFLDLIYDFIADRRYLFFGQKSTCRIPTEDEKMRFL